MAYIYKSGRNDISKITISIWVKIDQTDVDAVFNATPPDISDLVRLRMPLIVFGTTKDRQNSGETGHVNFQIPVSITWTEPDSNGDGSVLGANCSVTGVGITGTPISTSSGPAHVGLPASLDVTPGISGIAQVIGSDNTQELSFNFGGVLYFGHAPVGVSPSNPLTPGRWSLLYSFDQTLGINTTPISPSGLFIRASTDINFPDNTVVFLVAEEIVIPRTAPQGSYTLDVGATILPGVWNHVFTTLDITDQNTGGTVSISTTVNLGDQTVYNIPIGHQTWNTMGGDQFGLSMIPEEFNNWFSFGKNQKVRCAYFQVWFDQIIDPSNIVPYFGVIKGTNLVPPTNVFAASNQFGPPDIYCYRDKNKGVNFVTSDFTKAGTTPVDYTPGPGQSATTPQFSLSEMAAMHRQRALR